MSIIAFHSVVSSHPRTGLVWLTKILLVCVPFLAFGSAHAAVEIDHKPLKKVSSGKRITIEAEITEPGGIRRALLYFNSDQEPLWHHVRMTGRDTRYSGQILATDVTVKRLNYQFLVVYGDDEIQKSEVFTVKVKRDRKAAERLSQQEPTDIRIDVSSIEDAYDVKKALERYKRVDAADRSRELNLAEQPRADSRIEVRSEIRPDIDSLKGFRDYVNLSYVPGGEAVGVAAGVVEVSKAIPGAGAGAGTFAGAATVTGAGTGVGAVLGGVVLAGAAAGAAGSSGDDDGGHGGGGGSVPPGAVVSACGGLTTSGSDAPETHVVQLGRNSGTFPFSYEHYSIRDRVVVIYQGGTLFDSGCVGGSRSVNLSYSGGASSIEVRVSPNCAGGSSTLWEFRVGCP
jgi:hypothetical protein